MNDLLGGHMDIMCDLVANASGQIAAGAIEAYGGTGSARLAALPRAAIDRPSSALRNSLVDAGVKSKLAAIGTAPIAADRATPEALAALLIAEIAHWTPLIEAAGVEAQ
jgi:tripartite-type tricarboxylate transporter receptor subunit TctC